MRKTPILDAVIAAWSSEKAMGRTIMDLSAGAGNIVEVIGHCENQPQLIRGINRVLKPAGRLLVSTPNVLQLMSRMRFLFTGFLHGRIRPVHYSKKPGQAPNIYLRHFYELYYLLFRYGSTVSELRQIRVKLPSRFLLFLLWPLMRVSTLFAIVYAEKDPIQRADNRPIMSFMFPSAILLSNNIVVKGTKIAIGENSPGS